jgi:hypothetical protein
MFYVLCHLFVNRTVSEKNEVISMQSSFQAAVTRDQCGTKLNSLTKFQRKPAI